MDDSQETERSKDELERDKLKLEIAIMSLTLEKMREETQLSYKKLKQDIEHAEQNQKRETRKMIIAMLGAFAATLAAGAALATAFFKLAG
ncbi:MAG: hypothetical protein KDG89_16650 [Geminicoccaceae bacterium]|nr:hypothetical protein [Geminicoccaceae bacterium]